MPHKDSEVRRARDRERFARRTPERRAQGLCPKCGKRPPEPERSMCVPCAERARAAGRARDARLRAASQPRRNQEKARAYERMSASAPAGRPPSVSPGVSAPSAGATPPSSTAAGAGHGPRSAVRRTASGTRPPREPASSTEHIESKRRIVRIATRKRQKDRREAGRCMRCGGRPPTEGGASCEPCREIRQTAERELYATRRGAGLCTRYGGPTTDGGSRCATCAVLEAERGRPERRNALGTGRSPSAVSGAPGAGADRAEHLLGDRMAVGGAILGVCAAGDLRHATGRRPTT